MAMVSSAGRSGRRCEPRGDVRFLSRLILEAMPRRSVEHSEGGDVRADVRARAFRIAQGAKRGRHASGRRRTDMGLMERNAPQTRLPSGDFRIAPCPQVWSLKYDGFSETPAATAF